MGSPYYRTFVGLPLQVDQAFLDSRERLMTRLSEERISWTRPEQYHVTMRFLGDTDKDSMGRICDALRKDMPLPLAHSLEFNGLASFGPLRRPRVIWAGFGEKAFFEDLKQDLDRVLASCGIPTQEQPFRAHLTLGRVRSLKNPGEYYNAIEELHRGFTSPVLFDRLVFFRSILGDHGPEYQVLEECRF